MPDTVELVDLSLFAESPTRDHHFSVRQISRQVRFDEALPAPRYRSRTIPADYTNKPLPPLPSRRLRSRPRPSASRGCEPECILKRIQRIGSNDSSTSQPSALLQRRNPLSPPALTLSVPSSRPWNRNPASAMVWMPDEQMWLITGEEQQEPIGQAANQAAYPSPPAYTPRAAPRSEPLPNIPPPFDLTPPLTPVQYQLQSLIQPPRRRDDERLSPLFQEAMNSVPMMDQEQYFPPSLSIDTTLGAQNASFSQHLRPQSTLERSASDVSPQSTPRHSAPTRSASAGSRISHSRSDSSESRGYRSSTSGDLTQPANSAKRWAGLAKRIAKPEPETESSSR